MVFKRVDVPKHNKNEIPNRDKINKVMNFKCDLDNRAFLVKLGELGIRSRYINDAVKLKKQFNDNPKMMLEELIRTYPYSARKIFRRLGSEGLLFRKKQNEQKRD